MIMNECEMFSNLKVPCCSKIVIRIDGRNFSQLSHNLELEKPYDLEFVKIMVKTCHDFFQEFSPSLIYTFSDEINILLNEIPFRGRLEKMDSIFASFISGTFTSNIINNEEFSKIFENPEIYIKPISFDSRVILLNSAETVKYFKYRQDKAWVNCLNGYAYWTLRREYGKDKAIQILYKKKSNQIHDILFEQDMNIADIPLWQRRGIGIYREEMIIQGYNPIINEEVMSKRWKPITDWKLPVFNEEFFHVNQIL
jgi:tRNA(His) guanylyltransferase